MLPPHQPTRRKKVAPNKPVKAPSGPAKPKVRETGGKPSMRVLGKPEHVPAFIAARSPRLKAC